MSSPEPQIEEQPLFEHDHDGCVFLGVYEGRDLYFCSQGGARPTVIARQSSDGGDYLSGLCFADTIRFLGEARGRAQQRGLL